MAIAAKVKFIIHYSVFTKETDNIVVNHTFLLRKADPDALPAARYEKSPKKDCHGILDSLTVCLIILYLIQSTC